MPPSPQALPAGRWAVDKTHSSVGFAIDYMAGTFTGLFSDFEYNFEPRPSVFGSKITLSGWQLRLGYAFDVKGLPKTGTAEVIGEGRKVPVTAGRFEDVFGPYAVHLYRIR